MIRVSLSDNTSHQVCIPQFEVRITTLNNGGIVIQIMASPEKLDELNGFIRQYRNWSITITAFPGETFPIKRFDDRTPLAPNGAKIGTQEDVNSWTIPKDGDIVTSIYF